MKKIRSLSILLLVALMVLNCFLCSCSKDGIVFGEFGYNGRFLTAFAQKVIKADEAKTIISANYGNYKVAATGDNGVTLLGYSAAPDGSSGVVNLSLAPTTDALPSAEQVATVLNNYSAVNVTVKYYVDGSDDQKTKVDMLQGTDFKSVIEKNEYQPFGQLLVKYIVCFPELIDDMEASNAAFKVSGQSLVAPFADVFTYHTDANGCIVLQTRDFTEIPSSVGGGIGCSYRQDTEILYDNENKLVKWQTSLGVWTAAPEGTMKQGYILEVSLDWIPKT